MAGNPLPDPRETLAAHPFRYSWRPYQERVLRELDAHRSDRHIHVVAAPGSGKTVLGLEAVRRLAEPALILAPSIAIRDQWIQRYLELFLRSISRPEWISVSLDQPGILTAVTYQSLAAAVKRRGVKSVIRSLREAGVTTLVFDEAHHLRREWWKALHAVKKGLDAPHVIALTATPPYDVSPLEWNRYIDLCGDVDAEVSVPELVRAANLCPHQDFVYFSPPVAEEEKRLRAWAARVASLLRDLSLNEAFLKLLLRHPVLARPEDYYKALADQSDYFLSLAIFLHHAEGVVPRRFLRALGLQRVPLPAFHVGWAEILLEGVLYQDRESYPDGDETIEAVTKELRRLGALDRRGVHLRENPRLVRRLRSSRGKLDSIAAITEHESRLLRHRLRLLILTDYIREGYWTAGEAFDAQARVGVVPIFEHLRRLRLPEVRLGIATGKLTVIPASAEPALAEAALRTGLDPALLVTRPLEHDAGYLHLACAGRSPSELLPLLTRLFSLGEINTLIGTASLLGEGWDAPKINALILATVVGSFMLSNQMRGRAIRTDSEDEFKTANIWHLACVHPPASDVLGIADEKAGPAPSPYESAAILRHTAREGREDIDLLDRRFRCFIGLAFDEPVIRDGLERLGVKPGDADPETLGRQNARMCAESEERDRLAARWREALDQAGDRGRLAREVLLPPEILRRHPVLEGLIFGGGGLREALHNWLLSRRARRAGRALADALRQCGLIAGSGSRPRVAVHLGATALHVRLHGVEAREEALFVQSLQEIFDPLWSPRYLLVQGRRAFGVPKALGVRRERADAFQHHWRRRVGKARLVYTGSAEGRRRLVQVKQLYLATLHRDIPESRSVWT